MDILKIIGYWSKQPRSLRKHVKTSLLIQWMILSVAIISCKPDPFGSNWVEEGSFTISQYLEKNKEEYSKFFMLLDEGKMLGTLYAYNPYGEDYTLFLPTNDAIDQFIRKSQDYGNFEELLKDTAFIRMLTRYHTINRKVHTDEFPDGALNDTTLTGDRLVIGFYTEGGSQLIKVNNSAPIIKSNLKMTNGYIHVISGVLQQAEITGYDWLQQQDDFSILAQAMELCGIRKRLLWNKYTILAEHDSIYHRIGINNIEDLVNRVGTPGKQYSDRTNSFYQFTAYHILNKEFYLNDLLWGNKKYQTLSNVLLTINVGLEIQFNPGIDTYGIKISETGDTAVINYISPVWKDCNIMTSTGPVHSISDVLYFKPLH
jgi:uncharacterized surface protein with fasciclin (FAS1) repeats